MYDDDAVDDDRFEGNEIKAGSLTSWSTVLRIPILLLIQHTFVMI